MGTAYLHIVPLGVERAVSVQPVAYASLLVKAVDNLVGSLREGGSTARSTPRVQHIGQHIGQRAQHSHHALMEAELSACVSRGSLMHQGEHAPQSGAPGAIKAQG